MRTRTLIAAIVAAGVLPTAGLALAATAQTPRSGPSDHSDATAGMGSMMDGTGMGSMMDGTGMGSMMDGTDMASMMQDMPVGRMHRHMRDMGMDIGQMHEQMQEAGMDVGEMHQMHQPGDATDDRE